MKLVVFLVTLVAMATGQNFGLGSFPWNQAPQNFAQYPFKIDVQQSIINQERAE